MKKYLFLIIAFFSFIPISLAECSYEEQVRLSTEAQNVQIVYEIMENTTDEQIKEASYPYNDYIKVTVYNVTENITVSFTDNVPTEEGTSFSSVDGTVITSENASNGSYSFDVDILQMRRIMNATIDSQSNNCPLRNERNEQIVLPYFNSYYTYDGCRNNPEYYCSKYLSTPLSMNHDQVVEAIENYQPEKVEEPVVEEEENISIWWFVMVIGGGIVIVALLIAIGVVLYRIKQRRSVI